MADATVAIRIADLPQFRDLLDALVAFVLALPNDFGARGIERQEPWGAHCPTCGPWPNDDDPYYRHAEDCPLAALLKAADELTRPYRDVQE